MSFDIGGALKYMQGVVTVRMATLVALVGLLGCGRTPSAEIGAPCLVSTDCTDDALCFGAADGQPVCMLRCAADTRLCEGGEVCVQSMTDPEARVCYIGGTEPVGDGCATGGECAPGGVCLEFDEMPESRRCFAACDTRDPECGEGEACTVLDEPAGYCVAPMEE